MLTDAGIFPAFKWRLCALLVLWGECLVAPGEKRHDCFLEMSTTRFSAPVVRLPSQVRAFSAKRECAG
jgi:hypothetical protein